MELHLEEIALDVQPGAHAVLFVDQAGWRVTGKLNVPENMTRSATVQITGAQSGRKYLAVHAGQLALQPIFKSYDDIVDHCCFSWKKHVARPWLIKSIGMRKWAHGCGF